MSYLRHVLGCIAGCCALLSGPQVLAAEHVFEKYFATMTEGLACYERSYNAAHLKRNPKQKVRDLEIDMTPATPDDKPNTAAEFQLGFGVRVKGDKEWYTGLAICKSTEAGAQCYLEGDGGEFTLASGGGDAIELKTSRIALEGQAGFVDFAENSDDRIFVLKRSPRAVCDQSTADVR